ncbi:MAG: AAA family ATPase [Solibacillus sp.]
MDPIFGNLTIENFRGIKQLSLNNLSNLNIITGDNNSGKTTFLEALMILTQNANIGNIFRILKIRENKGVVRPFSRELDDFKILEYMFNVSQNKDNLKVKIYSSNDKIEYLFQLEGKMEKIFVDSEVIEKYLKKSRRFWDLLDNKDSIIIDEETLNFEGVYKFINDKESSNDLQLELFELNDEKIKTNKITANKFNINKLIMDNKRSVNKINYHFISSIDHVLKNDMEFIFKIESFKTEVVGLLKIFDNDIEDILITKENNNYVNCIKCKNKGVIPLSLYGDGIKKVIILADGIIRAKNGVLLIDEIETSIHKRVMKDLFSWLVKASNHYNVQLFITTHSLEVVDEFLDVNNESYFNETRIVTIHNNKDSTIARVLSGEEASSLRENFNMELRK